MLLQLINHTLQCPLTTHISPLYYNLNCLIFFWRHEIHVVQSCGGTQLLHPVPQEVSEYCSQFTDLISVASKQTFCKKKVNTFLMVKSMSLLTREKKKSTSLPSFIWNLTADFDFWFDFEIPKRTHGISFHIYILQIYSNEQCL